MFSVRCDKIRIREDREIFFIDICICVESRDENFIRSCTKMSNDFFIELLCCSRNIGSLTYHFIACKLVKRVVKITKYS